MQANDDTVNMVQYLRHIANLLEVGEIVLPPLVRVADGRPPVVGVIDANKRFRTFGEE